MSEENLYTFENEAYRKTYWHTCSHIMAQAVKRLWPEVKLAIGPSIDLGWYYDFDAPFAFNNDHLAQIEAEKCEREERERAKREARERAEREAREQAKDQIVAFAKAESLNGHANSVAIRFGEKI